MREIKVYQYSELSEKAKQVAIENYLDSEREFHWGNEWVETIKNGLKHFGFGLGNRYIIHYDSATQSHAPIEWQDDVFKIAELAGVRLWKYLHNNDLLTYFCKYWKKKRDLLDGDCPFTGYCGDEVFLDPVREFVKQPTNITFLELMKDCVWKTLLALQDDYEHQNSEEFANEELEIMDWEYFEDGRWV